MIIYLFYFISLIFFLLLFLFCTVSFQNGVRPLDAGFCQLIHDLPLDKERHERSVSKN